MLDGFAATLGAGPDKTVILVPDGAGWHVSKRLQIPQGIRLCFPPPPASTGAGSRAAAATA